MLPKLNKLLALITSLAVLNIHSGINDYLYPFSSPTFSNYGGIGIIQNPSARFLREGSLAFSWSHYDPYLRGSIIAYPFDWLEASFQYVDINDQLYSNIESFSGSQSLKDKSFDIKINLLKESIFLPQIAVGFRDIGGTGLFSSEYLTFNKLLPLNVDLTFGIGWGYLNGNTINNPLEALSDSFSTRNSELGLGGKFNIKDLFSGDAGYFMGFEAPIKYLNGLKIKFEYDGTNYQNEAGREISQSSKVNFGVVYPLSEFFNIKASITRGNTFNFGFSFKLNNIGNNNPYKIKKPKQEPLQRPDLIKVVTSKSDNNLYRASFIYLKNQNINVQKVNIEEDEIHVVISQSQLNNPAITSGRILNTLTEISPDRIKKFKVSEINGGMGLYSASIARDNFTRYKHLYLPEVQEKNLTLTPFNFNDAEYNFVPQLDYPALFYNIGPDLRSQIGGPEGFFFGDLKVTFDSEVLFSRNLSLISTLSHGLYDNMDDLTLPSNSILPHVRTEIVQYLKQSRNLSIRRMQLNYFNQIDESIFLKLSGGILESMFSGYGFELLYRPYNKDYGIGIDLWDVVQRDYDQMLDNLKYRTLTGHLTFYYEEPNTNILFQVKGGRYLAKDSGFTFDFSRIFRSGLRIGAFFTLTDISAEEFGEGSFDKGFYFWIPIDIFTPYYSKRNFGWGLRPITRDGGQTLNYSHPLWGVTNLSSRKRFIEGLNQFYD